MTTTRDERGFAAGGGASCRTLGMGGAFVSDDGGVKGDLNCMSTV